MDGMDNLKKINKLLSDTGVKIISNENDFVRFLEQGAKTDEEYGNGAVIVITGKQYVFAVNGAGGAAPHDPTYATLMQALSGNAEKNLGWHEKMRLTTACRRNFLTARILYEKGEKDCAGGIVFNLTGDKKITANQYIQFEKFYLDFNDIIRRMTQYYPRFSVQWTYNDNGRTVHASEMSDLTVLRDFLLTKIDYDLNDNDEDEIYITGEFAGLSFGNRVSNVRK